MRASDSSDSVREGRNTVDQRGNETVQSDVTTRTVAEGGNDRRAERHQAEES